jgi:hypothetical protein
VDILRLAPSNAFWGPYTIPRTRIRCGSPASSLTSHRRGTWVFVAPVPSASAVLSRAFFGTLHEHHVPAFQINHPNTLLRFCASPHRILRNVTSERGRRASHHHISQFVFGEANQSFVDNCTSQVAPRGKRLYVRTALETYTDFVITGLKAHHGNTGWESAASSAHRVSGCSVHCRGRRREVESCGFPTAAVCGDNRKCYTTLLLLSNTSPVLEHKTLSASHQLPHFLALSQLCTPQHHLRMRFRYTPL